MVHFLSGVWSVLGPALTELGARERHAYEEALRALYVAFVNPVNKGGGGSLYTTRVTFG